MNSEKKYFSVKLTNEAFPNANRLVQRLPPSKHKKEYEDSINYSNHGRKDRFTDISESPVRWTANEVKEQIKVGGRLSEETKVGLQLLLSFTFSNNSNDNPQNIRDALITVESVLRLGSKEDYLWFYEQVVGLLSGSQLKKLSQAYNLSPVPQKMDSDEFSHSQLGYNLYYQLQNVFYPSPDRKREKKTEISDETSAFLVKVIELFTSINSVHTVSGSSVSYLGLDRSGKEALCWRELELSKSGNIELARIAATIAWKIWLFKVPLLEAYCREKNVDMEGLNFSMRAQLTKEAVENFSDEERAIILDTAVEREVEKRKKSLVPEDREEFKGKRVSLGDELEIIEPPVETAAIYGWYENLDRSTNEDSMAHMDTIQEVFEIVSNYKDAEVQLVTSAKKIAKAKRLLLQKPERVGRSKSIEKKEFFTSQVLELVEDIDNQRVKKILLNYIAETENGIFESDLLKNVIQVLELAYKKKLLDVQQLKVTFFDLYERVEFDEGYASLSSSVSGVSGSSTTVKIMLDVFKHHMGQAQVLGHKYKSDSYGEHALAHVSGDYKNPYGMYSRELWELAQAGFHDLEVDARPMHLTIGWEAYMKRGLSLPSSVFLSEASILNFALMGSGTGFRQYILDYKKANEEAKAKGKRRARIDYHGDTGRMDIIRFRQSMPYTQMEFRGFAPSKWDLPRLQKDLGYLGTAMIAYLFCKYCPDSADEIDKQLSEIWLQFRARVKAMHSKKKKFLSLENANEWQFDEQYYVGRRENVEYFYDVVSSSYGKKRGFMAEMNRAVREARVAVMKIFGDTPIPENSGATPAMSEGLGLNNTVELAQN